MNYDEQIKGLVEELLEQLTDQAISMEELREKLAELNQKIDEQQEFERDIETKFLADLQLMVNKLNYADDPEVRETAKKIIRLIYQHRIKYAEIRYLEENIG